MKRKVLLLFILFFSTLEIIAQKTEVSGILRDTTAKVPVKGAVVLLLSPRDSILRSFTRSGDDGSYTLKNIPQGKSILMVMHPLFADFVDDIDVTGEKQVLQPIAVTSKSKLLAAVIIKSGSPIRIKGDTTIYTADSFSVSANANVEELLKKLPGIQVDKNGEIKAMGEKVEKVLVDGEEFFGDDPGMAVKNLRADAVKEVQVFDKKSDQSEFTGIDDGKTQKTINLKLKEDRKKGYFGKLSFAGGLANDLPNRFNNNIMFGSFKGKRKLSGFFLSGNTGQNGLSWQDNDKYGGSNDDMGMSFDDEGGFFMYSWNGGGADDEPYVNTENGFIRNINTGFQYSNKWNDKKTFNFSPKFNLQDYNNLKNTYTQTQVWDSIHQRTNFFETRDVSNMSVDRTNFKSTAVYDIKLDSNNTLKFTAKANFYHTESNEFRNSATILKNDGSQTTGSSSNLKKEIDKQSITGNAIFKHKFRKLRRTLSLNADWNLLNTDGTNFNRTHNESYDPILIVTDLDQKLDSKKNTQKLTSRLVYTEPLSKKYSMEFSYELSYSYGKNDQNSYSYNPTTKGYDDLVDSLTNKFRQSIIINKPGIKLNYSDKKIKFNFGSGFGITQFRLNNLSQNKNYDRNYTNIFPTASFIYTYKTNHSFRINYSGNTTQPTINQLQPLQNNTDQFNRYIGNPDLKPSFANNFAIVHNSYNFLKEMWMYQTFNIIFTGNSITNSRVISSNGATTSQPINTDGNISMNLWAGTGFKSKKLKTQFMISPNGNYSRYADVINGIKSFSNTVNAGLGLNASKTKDKKYDVSVNNDFSYNNNKNAQSSTSSNFFTNTLTVNATVYYKKVWSIITDWNYFHRQKTEQFTNNNDNQIWNAKLQRTFKKDQFTIFIEARDILNQNIGINRSFYGNYITEETNQRLKRYFMLGFSWDFKNKGAVAAGK